MKPTFKDGVNYIGIKNHLNIDSKFLKIFIVSDEIKLINKFNTEIKNIIQIKCEPYITKTNIIKTPIGTSIEGEILTGNKIFLKGYIDCDIQYSIDTRSTNIYKYNKKINFSNSLTLLSDYAYNSKVVTIQPYIIDILSTKLTLDTTYLTLTIQVNLEY